MWREFKRKKGKGQNQPKLGFSVTKQGALQQVLKNVGTPSGLKLGRGTNKVGGCKEIGETVGQHQKKESPTSPRRKETRAAF